jgi:hypothetical protein
LLLNKFFLFHHNYLSKKAIKRKITDLIGDGLIDLETESTKSDSLVEQLSYVEIEDISDQEEDVFEETKSTRQQTPKESSAMSSESNKSQRRFFFAEKRPILSSGQANTKQKLRKLDENNNK